MKFVGDGYSGGFHDLFFPSKYEPHFLASVGTFSGLIEVKT